MKRPWVTWILIAANVAAFAVELASGVDPVKPTSQQLLPLGADFAPYTLGDHQWWRLVTSMFLHFGVIHIGMNMLCLWQGKIVEQLYGRVGFVVLYMVAGIIGGVASLAHADNVVSAGASGAVFGVFGAFGAFLVRRREQIDPAVWKNSARRLGTFLVLNIVISLQPGIDMSAHVGGLITGFLCGLVLLGERRALRAAAVAIVGLGLSAGALAALPAPFDVDRFLDEFRDTEHACVAKANELLDQYNAKKLDDHQLADAFERDVLPPWHVLRERTDATHPQHLTAYGVKLFENLRAYAADREDAWHALVLAHRGQGSISTYEDYEARVHDDLTRLDAGDH